MDGVKMSGLRSHIYVMRILYVFVDVLIILLAYTMVMLARTIIAWDEIQYGLPFLIGSVVAIIAGLYLNRVYHRLWSRTSGYGIFSIVLPVLIVTPIQVVVDLLIIPRPVPLTVILIGNVLATGGFISIRYRSRLITGFLWRWDAVVNRNFPESKTGVLIIGAGEAGAALARQLQYGTKNRPFRVVGFVDDDTSKRGMLIENRTVLGTTADIPSLVNESNIELLIVAIHSIAGVDFRRILEICEQTPARIKVIPNLFSSLDRVKNQPLLRDVSPEDLIGRSTISRHEAVDLSLLSDKVIMVTGAAGSIGSELSTQLVAFEPRQLLLLDNNESALHDLHLALKQVDGKQEIIPILADVTDCNRLREVMDAYTPAIIFHSAAYKHVPILQDHPYEAIRVNIGGTNNIAQLACQSGVERFVLISTDKAVAPASVMGASKRLCEWIMHAYAQTCTEPVKFSAVRFGNVLGSRGSVLPIFNRQIDAGGPVTVTHQEMTRFFMSIPEAANLVIHAACLTENDDIFVLQMGEVVRIVELAERMIRLRGLRPYKDIPIEFTGVRAGEKMHEQLYSNTQELESTVHPSILRLTNWDDDHFKPRTFLDEIENLTNASYRSQADVFSRLETLWAQALPINDRGARFAS